MINIFKNIHGWQFILIAGLLIGLIVAGNITDNGRFIDAFKLGIFLIALWILINGKKTFLVSTSTIDSDRSPIIKKIIIGGIIGLPILFTMFLGSYFMLGLIYLFLILLLLSFIIIGYSHRKLPNRTVILLALFTSFLFTSVIVTIIMLNSETVVNYLYNHS